MICLVAIDIVMSREFPRVSQLLRVRISHVTNTELHETFNEMESDSKIH